MLKQSDSAYGLFFIRATVLAAIILGIVANTGARAGQDKTGLKIALVNPGRLLAEYKFAKAANDTLEKVDGEAKNAILTWNHYPLLTGADQDALVKLIQKENTPATELTKTEKDDEQRLKTKHDNLVKEYQELLGKPNGALNAQDVARLDAFSKLKSDSDNRIKAKQTEATSEINKQQETFNQKIEKDIHEAINKVAKDKGMNLVFSSQVVLYADTDITDDVLKHLNK
jgi:Skp family chaperone for outer membrane proteins